MLIREGGCANVGGGAVLTGEMDWCGWQEKFATPEVGFTEMDKDGGGYALPPSAPRDFAPHSFRT